MRNLYCYMNICMIVESIVLKVKKGYESLAVGFKGCFQQVSTMMKDGKKTKKKMG